MKVLLFSCYAPLNRPNPDGFGSNPDGFGPNPDGFWSNPYVFANRITIRKKRLSGGRILTVKIEVKLASQCSFVGNNPTKILQENLIGRIG